MLLIYTEHTSTRLQYICRFIFEELLSTTCSLTLHESSFDSHDGPKINYSSRNFTNAYHIIPHGLLFEKGIRHQQLNEEGEGERFILFKSTGADHHFDIFSAAFFLLSRYEEYLPHEEDEYGRYAHVNSLAYKNNFLDLPLINIWAKELGEALRKKYSSFIPHHSAFHFLPTYDIDIAWSYKEKGWLRTIGGLFRYPSVGRLAALLGMKEDPSDSYRFLDNLHQLNSLVPKYFFLVAKENSDYDRNILPGNDAMQELIKQHSTKYEVGLHPSWKSNSNENLLEEEKNILEKIAGKKISISRQHYIKFELPETYRKLAAAGIAEDYSMGYGSINGFRASAASSFFWFDLLNETITALRVQPFCFMDANCFYEEKLDPEQSYESLMKYYLVCKKYNGTLITIFHNNFLGTDKKFEGWKELYKKFIAQLQ